MKYLLILLLLTGNAALATSSTPLDKLSNQELCALISMELDIAVRLGIITEDEMADIEGNCYRN
jgi:hypothetical protein